MTTRYMHYRGPIMLIKYGFHVNLVSILIKGKNASTTSLRHPKHTTCKFHGKTNMIKKHVLRDIQKNAHWSSYVTLPTCIALNWFYPRLKPNETPHCFDEFWCEGDEGAELMIKPFSWVLLFKKSEDHTHVTWQWWCLMKNFFFLKISPNLFFPP